LNALHPRGRHKARVFREALDLGQGDASWLREIFLEAAAFNEAFPLESDIWGSRWRVDVTVQRHQKGAVVRTLLIVRTGENRPSFVTCWVSR
jgi:hypothetical protein